MPHPPEKCDGLDPRRRAAPPLQRPSLSTSERSMEEVRFGPISQWWTLAVVCSRDDVLGLEERGEEGGRRAEGVRGGEEVEK